MIKCILLLLLSLTLANSVVNAQRDPLKWPFAVTSIWNMPIHNNAQYTPANIILPTSAGILADEDIIILEKSAPLTDLYISNADWNKTLDRCIATGGILLRVPIPSDFVYKKSNWLGSTPNAGLAVLMPDGKTIKNTQPFTRCNAGSVGTSHYNKPDNDLYGDGIEGAHGGSGMSVLGGCIRLGELVPNGVIKHAIKIELWGQENYYMSSSEATPGYRWPANARDANAKYYGKNPWLNNGSLLALAPSINIESLGLVTEAGKILAKCFQDYGAYIVDDCAWSAVAICTERSPQGSVVDEFKRNFGFDFESYSTYNTWAADFHKILLNLQVITNNTSSNIGGGPTTDLINRRASAATDFGAP